MSGDHAFRDRYFEDYRPGEVVEFGSVTVTEADIIAFASAYDPQPFHVDPEAARASPYGGLIASAWHTGSFMMRMMVDHFISSHSLGSPGMEEMRFLAPVRPGDTLRCRLTILEARRSATKLDRGTIKQRVEVLNQDSVVVFSCIGLGFYRCRSD
jgi:acyl dehydratase